MLVPKRVSERELHSWRTAFVKLILVHITTWPLLFNSSIPVGGFNPFEKYARQIVSFPQVSGSKSKKSLKTITPWLRILLSIYSNSKKTWYLFLQTYLISTSPQTSSSSETTNGIGHRHQWRVQGMGHTPNNLSVFEDLPPSWAMDHRINSLKFFHTPTTGLVGGWTTHLKKYDRQNGVIFPKIYGVKIRSIWNHHLVVGL